MNMITLESFRSQIKNLKTETHKRKINNGIFKDLKQWGKNAHCMEFV